MTIICDKCKAESEFRPLYRREGDLELTFLQCPECGAEYLGSVTDTALRKRIAHYEKLAHIVKTQQVTVPFMLRVQRLHEQNVRRSRKLRDQYMQTAPV